MSDKEKTDLDDLVIHELEVDLAEKFPVDMSSFENFKESILAVENNEDSLKASVFIPNYGGSKWNVEFVSKFQKKFKKLKEKEKKEVYSAVDDIVKDPTGKKCPAIHPLTSPWKHHWEYDLSRQIRILYKFDSSSNQVCLERMGTDKERYRV